MPVPTGADTRAVHKHMSADMRSASAQLLAVLRTPNTPDQQQQILNILKAHPQLMSAFIKQRQKFPADQFLADQFLAER